MQHVSDPSLWTLDLSYAICYVTCTLCHVVCMPFLQRYYSLIKWYFSNFKKNKNIYSSAAASSMFRSFLGLFVLANAVLLLVVMQGITLMGKCCHTLHHRYYNYGVSTNKHETDVNNEEAAH